MDSLTIIRFTCRGIRETGHLQQMIFFFERDITEISGFDNLHHAEGILKEAQEYAAQIYGTKKWFLQCKWKYGGSFGCSQCKCK